MKNVVLLIVGLLLNAPGIAKANCFLAIENNQIIEQEGDCESRHSPCSTFKIAISLMAYNEGLLIDEDHPQLPFKDGYVDFIESWKQAQTPISWMKNSCVWYSQNLTHELGMEKFQGYIEKFNYGNQDVSGDIGKDNGITHAWLSSSLEISPVEQINFLQKLIHNELPVSINSHKMTKKILFVEDLPNGWKLYGKTGSGSLLSQDRSKKLEQQIGWFIGWIQKKKRTIIFVKYVEDKDKQDTYASIRARAAAKEKLMQISRSNS